MKTLHYCILLLLALSLSSEARTWTAKTGETIDGEFVKLESENVLIQLPNGSTVQIKLDLLSDADQKFVNEEVNPFKPTNNVNNPFVVVNPQPPTPPQPPNDGGDDGLDPMAIEKLRQAAERGDAESQNSLGLLYLMGIGVPEDDDEAVKWFRKAAEQGHAQAQYFLAVCYLNGNGVAQDAQQGISWLRKAAAQGNEQAIDTLQKLGITTPESKLGYNTPRDVLERETQNGNLEALYYLARSHVLGWNGHKKDEKKAHELFQRGSQSADTGNPYAQICRGNCHKNGIGVRKNEVEAVKWYRLAAEQGNAVGQFALGSCYTRGEGVRRNDVEAVKWLRLAAEQGDAMGQGALGFCYSTGTGVRQNEAEAIKWHRLAAEQGHDGSMLFLGFFYRDGTGVPKNEAEAVMWFRRAAEQGSEDAAKILRDLESRGGGTSTQQSQTQQSNSNINSGNIDPKIIGSWTHREYNYGDYGFTGLYNYQFKADGTFIQIKTGTEKHGSGYSTSENSSIVGKYTTSGGIVYLTDLVLTYSTGGVEKKVPLKNKSSEYKIEGDLEIKRFGTSDTSDSGWLYKFSK